MGHWFSKVLLSITVLVLQTGLFQFLLAQSPCTPNTPSYNVNLVGQPAGTWVSAPPIVRDGSCCGSTPPDRCIEFVITLDSNAIALNFTISSGAVPGGSMFYQIDCGPPTAVGDPICLTGGGPYYLTFCKPGNNLNTYAITSIPGPYASPDDSVALGCAIDISVNGLDPSTISWNDITGGGTYDSYLSCTQNCTTTTVSPQTGMPAFVDYQVCGMPLLSDCLPPVLFCDTVRVSFLNRLTASISPDPAVYCSNSNGVMLTPNISGGNGNYTLIWTNPAGGVTYDSTTYFASAIGNYFLEIRDENYPGCPPIYDSVSVSLELAPSIVTSPDISICEDEGPIPLTSSSTNASGQVWTGGTGSYNPSNLDANPSYTVSAADISSGLVSLNVSTTGNVFCPAASDQINVTISPAITTSISGNQIVCFGQTIVLNSVTGGGLPPYNYQWSTGESTSAVIGGAGIYYLTVTDNSDMMCQATAMFVVTENPQINVFATPDHQIICTTTSNVSANATGGAGNFGYWWSNGVTSSSQTVIPGTYVIVATDANGCSADDTVTVTGQASTLFANIPAESPICNGSLEEIVVNVSGGFPPFNYSWSTGNSDSTIVVGPGNYCVTVTDNMGCLFQTCTSIYEAPPLTAVIPSSQLLCPGQSTLVSVAASGGTPGYSYLWSTGDISPTVFLSAGNYSVTVTDANMHSCQVVTSTAVQNEPAIISSTNFNQPTCFGYADGSASVSVQGGVPGYTYEWFPGSNTTSVVNGLSAGNYTIEITDAIGCVQSTTVNVTQPLVLSVSPSNINHVTCFSYVNGSADVLTSGGTTPYIYNWFPSGGVNSTATGLPAGNYEVRVTDANGCRDTVSFAITQPTQVNFSSTVSHISCFSQNDGAITVTPSGGITPYTYTWSPNLGSTQSLSALIAGNYALTVSDFNNCTFSDNFQIIEPDTIGIQFTTVSNVSCNGASDGSISVLVNGGTTPYSYNWSNSSTTLSQMNLGQGNYTLTVTDSRGCTGILGVAISEPPVLTSTAAPTQNIACSNTVAIWVEPLGGSLPYSFNWSNGANNDTIYSAIPGNYIVTVTDFNGCSRLDSVLVTANNSNLSIGINAPTDICFNSFVEINSVVSNAISGYSLNWSNGMTADTIMVTDGNYCVTVTDGVGCMAQACTDLNENDNLGLNMNYDPFCLGMITTLYANAYGGDSSYSYIWDNALTSSSISAFSGNYLVTVTDGLGCMVEDSIAVVANTPISVNLVSTFNVSCNNGSNGGIDINISGGFGGYIYDWQPVGLASQDIYNIGAGSYTLNVVDTMGCSASLIASVSEPSVPLSLDSLDGENVTCYNYNNGWMSVTASGGSAPYNYNWWYNGSTSESVSGLSPGSYTVSVADTNGCVNNYTGVISQPNGLVSSTATVSDAKCTGSANGQATINATGGSPPYTYLWIHDTVSSPTMTGLTAGLYNVTVSDALGCLSITTLIVNEPTPINLNVSSLPATCTSATGSASVQPTGGSPGYVYLWSTGQTGSSISNLIQGNYNVAVSDSNSCFAFTQVTVNSLPSNVFTNGSVQNVNCNGASDGVIMTQAYGGIAPYNYYWPQLGYNLDTIQGIDSGNFTLIVTDSLGCTDTSSYFVSQPTPVVINLNKFNISCNGNSDGSIIAQISGGMPSYDYNWSTGDSAISISNLSAGTYTLTITDGNGCMEVGWTVMTNPPVLGSNIGPVTHISCNGFDNGEAVAVASGGSPPYSYFWTPGGETTASVDSLTPGWQYVQILDQNGCNILDSVEISEPTPLQITTSNDMVLCQNSNAVISVSAAGGAGGFSYFWDNGLGNNTTYAVSPSVTTTYHVTVTDANGCEDTTHQTTITVSGPLSLSLSLTDTIICEGETSFITSMVSGGGNQYQYYWSDSSFTSNNGPHMVSPTSTTNYTLIVLDTCGSNPVTQSVTVFVNPLPDVDLDAQPQTGCAPLYVNFVAATDQNPAGTSYIWDLGNGNSSTNVVLQETFTDPGVYEVVLTAVTPDGCRDSTSLGGIITVNPTVEAAFSSNIHQTSILESLVQFSDLSINATSWFWNFGEGGLSSLQNPQHEFTDTGMFNVMLIANNDWNCPDTAWSIIEILPEYKLFIPNAFTPFNRSLNNTFYPQGLCIDEYVMYIFDRWGDLIFETKDINEGWDGRAHDGEEVAQMDVYIYRIITYDCLGNEHDYIGHITLVK